MENIYSPKNDMELAFIKSLLEGENIYYHVKNDHFGTMKTGPRIDLYNTKHIFVGHDDADYAKALLNEFLNPKLTSNVSIATKKPYTVFDKIRMVLEVIIFNWFMPGKSAKKIDE